MILLLLRTFEPDNIKSLEHFEFGLDHKFWNKPKTFNDRLDINYWLEQWLLFFDKIIKYYSKNKNILIFKYENLEKQTMLDKIAKKISLINKDVLEFKIKNKEIDIYFDQKLFNECMKLYSEV